MRFFKVHPRQVARPYLLMEWQRVWRWRQRGRVASAINAPAVAPTAPPISAPVPVPEASPPTSAPPAPPSKAPWPIRLSRAEQAPINKARVPETRSILIRDCKTADFMFFPSQRSFEQRHFRAISCSVHGIWTIFARFYRS